MELFFSHWLGYRPKSCASREQRPAPGQDIHSNPNPCLNYNALTEAKKSTTNHVLANADLDIRDEKNANAKTAGGWLTRWLRTARVKIQLGYKSHES